MNNAEQLTKLLAIQRPHSAAEQAFEDRLFELGVRHDMHEGVRVLTLAPARLPAGDARSHPDHARHARDPAAVKTWHLAASKVVFGGFGLCGTIVTLSKAL